MNRRIVQIRLKYLLDRVFGVLLFLGLSPVLAVTALAVFAEDGHTPFFRQKRTGWRGTDFDIWKFRTMVPDADRLLDERGRVGEADRVTRVGKILRSLSLDEFPQLINIILGEMSFIGPRAGLPDRLARCTEDQRRRLLMKPGLTGLAQVNGRNTLKWSKRIGYDLWYIDHYSLGLDLAILARTLRVWVKREGIVMDRRPDLYDDLEP